MLKLIITVTMFMTALLCQAQVSETRKVERFSKIEVASGIELHYKESEEASVKIETNEGNLKDVFTEVEGETLRISSTENAENVKVYLATKDVESFKASSKSRILFENTIHTENISIVLESGAYFKGYLKSKGLTNIETEKNSEFNGRIETASFVGNFKSHSKVNISGNAEKATIKSAMKSYCNARNFLTKNTEVDSDNSIVIITSKNKINVNATDNAKVTYFGSPKKASIENKYLIDTKKHKRPTLIAMD
ncbi:hypothetical protein J2X31_002009 [Flavobacterium arsenatis]|uniref:Putative auto-transporter adhesin head GIN domain-containing protein n=1 Tax=Flavobacterium arsenatis TaxID=1484332 RepID=A0ABU1TPV5_9FLAO|nr:DUF2807 domain-containing protein [Flavobacterium arsenatis]MDR6967995.1 hypothetical protein [Flavobacterium arsenatis]